MVSRIIANTPIWVWLLLVALLWVGFAQTRTRCVEARSILTLPVVMPAMSLSGMVTSFGPMPQAMLAWAVATTIGTSLILIRSIAPSTYYDSVAGRFHVPGSWIPMAVILSIFSLKYATGVTLAVQPALASSVEFAAILSALYGGFSGIFVGRAVRLWRLRGPR
jgi:hypothetical protein